MSQLEEINVSQSPMLPKKRKILQDFKDLFLNREGCDVVFRVKGQKFPAHKAILIGRCPVFAATFRNNMKEKATGIVDIKDCDPSSFSDFLCFLYSEDVDNLSSENAFSLFTTADKYDVADLREKCMKYIKNNLSVDTFCETITLALKHTEIDLIRLATDYFIKNAESILVTAKWQSFAAENPMQSNELFIKFVATDRCLEA